MRATRLAIAAIAVFVPALAYANAACEAKAKTRDDFLACANEDTDRILADAEKLYRGVRKLAKGDKQAALDANFQVWKNRLKSDCQLTAYAFNDWSNEYSPDTDFQVSACRAKIAGQELEFYKWLSCPSEMEASSASTCSAVRSILGGK